MVDCVCHEFVYYSTNKFTMIQNITDHRAKSTKRASCIGHIILHRKQELENTKKTSMKYAQFQ